MSMVCSSDREKIVAVSRRGRQRQLGKQSDGCCGRRIIDVEIGVMIEIVAGDGLLGDWIDELLGGDEDKA